MATANLWVDTACRPTMEGLLGYRPVFRCGHETKPGYEYLLPRGVAWVEPHQERKDGYFVPWEDLGDVIDLLCDSGVDWIV
jgi:hypothetical protein